MTTASDRLSRAATKLRELSEAATAGPWSIDGPFWWRGGNGSDCTALITGHERAAVCVMPDEATRTSSVNADAAFIATMHPGVGLALADWLEGIGSLQRALALADALLGEDA